MQNKIKSKQIISNKKVTFFLDDHLFSCYVNASSLARKMLNSHAVANASLLKIQLSVILVMITNNCQFTSIKIYKRLKQTVLYF